MFENFPYTNMHQLNLDWIIKIAKDFLDQYTHIQQLISDGEASLQNLTEEGLQQLSDKADELEGLLNEWYNTHSEDIASQLAAALDDLNAQLDLNTTTFNQRAEQKGASVIASIPADYTTLSEKVANLIENNSFNLTPKITGTHENRGITFEWNVNGSCYVHGTQTGGGTATENLYDNHSVMTEGFEAGKTYFVNFTSSNNMRLQILGFKADDSMVVFYSEAGSLTAPKQFTIPNDIVGMTIRLAVLTGATVDETVKPIIRQALSNQELSYNQVNLQPAVEELQNNVADLQAHELSMNFSNSTNLNSIDLWEYGSISQVTGENVVSSGRIRTIYPLATNIASIKLPTKERGFFILGYEPNGTYIGTYKSDGTFSQNDDGSGYDEFNFSSIYEKYNNIRLRLYLYSRNGQNISLSEANGIMMKSIYNQLVDPIVIRVMDYNIGRFNFGHDGGYSGDALGLKLSNYRKLMNDYNPNILCLQEYRPYVNADNSANADYIIFDYVFPYKAYDEDTYLTYGYVNFMDYMPTNTRHTYLHQDGDYPVHMVYSNVVINNMQIAVGSVALNSLGGSDDAAMKIRALTKMIEKLSDYETAIIGIDANVMSEAEANAVKTFMKSNGFYTANWDYIGYLPTYNPSSDHYKAIDNIFIKGKAKFKHVEVVPTSRYNDLLSDHMPIIADVLIYK